MIMRKILCLILILSPLFSLCQGVQGDSYKGTAAGTNSYSVTINAITAASIYDGQKILVKFINANTGASTLVVSGAGSIIYPVKAIEKQNGMAVSLGDITAGSQLRLSYNSTFNSWQILGGVGASGVEMWDSVKNNVTIPGQANDIYNKNFGRVLIGVDTLSFSNNKTYDDVTTGILHLYGSATGGGGSRIFFGDVGGQLMNPFIGERWQQSPLLPYDTDKLQIGGKRGIYFATGLDNDTIIDKMIIDSAGNVGINTLSPTTKLHVVGSVRMVDGNQASGKVLTSDANGVGSWVTPSVGGTVTDVSVVTSNGMAGTVANATTSPDITLSTTVTGMVKANGTSLLPAVPGPGNDYLTVEIDDDISNELQTISNSSDATSHTATLSDGGGSIKLAEGSNITLATTGTIADGVVTISGNAGSVTSVNAGTNMTISAGSASVNPTLSTIQNPVFTQSVTSPLKIGGTTTTSSLTYKTTTGVGTTGADHVFQVGNNGATEAMRILNSGSVGIGTSAPAAGSKLQVISQDAGTGGGTGIGVTVTNTSSATDNRAISANVSSGTGTNNIALYGLGASGTNNYGVWGEAGTGGTNNYGGYFLSQGGTNNYGVCVPFGNSGFGTATPTELFQVSGTNSVSITANGSIIQDQIYTRNQYVPALADDATYTVLKEGAAGKITVLCYENNGAASIDGFVQCIYVAYPASGTGIVTQIASVDGINAAVADTDTKLCVYISGEDVIVKNRLGGSRSIMILLDYY